MKLFTNLSHVRVDVVFMSCNALLLEPGDDLTPRDRIRGFGPESAWPIFQTPVPSLDYEQKVHMHPGVVLSEDVNELPIGTGITLRFAEDGPEVLLSVEHPEKAIKVDDCSEMDIMSVWRLLEQRTPEFWYAPHMPYLGWGPPAMIANERIRAQQRQARLALAER